MANTIRIQALPKFPASVEAGDGIVIERSGGVFTFSVDPGAFQPADADLAALADNSTNGLWARTGAGTGAARTLTGTANEIAVANGNGGSGNPTVSLPAALTFTGKTVTGGTFASPTISGAATITATATVSSAWVFDVAPTSRQIDSGAVEGPLFSTFRDSASPAANDLIGYYGFFGRDSAGNIELYGRVQGVILDPTSGSEDSQISIWTNVAGTAAARLNVAQGAWIGSATGTDKGAGTLNLAGDLYNNGTAPTGTGGYVRSASPILASPTIQLDDDTAVAGPVFSLFRNSASPAANDLIGFVSFFSRDSAANIQEYARIQGAIIDPTSGSEDGELQVQTVVAGTLAVRGAWQQGLVVGSATDQGAGSITASAGIKSIGPTAGIGYLTGAGGAVTQGTSRTTGVTLNKVCGAITLASAAGSVTPASFTVTNSAVAATDVIIVNQKSGTDKYEIFVTAVAAGSFQITFFTTGGTTTEQPVFNFAVIKGVAA